MRALTVDELMSKVTSLLLMAPNSSSERMAAELGEFKLLLTASLNPGKSMVQTLYPSLRPEEVAKSEVVKVLDSVKGHLASALLKAGELPVGGIQSATYHNVYHTTQTALAIADFARRQL